MPVITQLVGVVSLETAAVERGILGLASKLGAGGPLAIAGAVAGAAVIGVGVASVKMAGDFQAGVITLKTGAGELQSNLGLVSAGMLKLATDTGTSTKQLVDGMFMIESAGFHGAQGLDVLKNAAEGAKVGAASLGTVADGVTTLMVDFKDKNLSAAQATNILIATVANGKTHMEDLAKSIAMVAPAASATHVSIDDMAGAMATMTGIGVPAANAATYLRQMLIALAAPAKGAEKALKAIGLTTQEVSDGMKKSLPDTLAMITQHLKATYGDATPKYVEGLKAIAGGSKQMQAFLDLTGEHLSTFNGNVKAVAQQVKDGGSAIVGWSDVQGTFNQKIDTAKAVVEVLMIKIGTGLLPVVGHLVDAFSTAVPAAMTAVQGAFTWLGQHGDLVKAALIGIGLALLNVLIPALGGLAVAAWTALAPILIAVAPFLLVAAAVAALAYGAQQLYTHFQPFRQVVDAVVAALKSAWGIIVANVQPVFKQLSDVFQQQLVPAWKALQPALAQAMPLFQAIGVIIGVVLVVALGIVIGLIVGLAKGLAGLIAGAARALGGIIQIVAGFIAVFLAFWGGLFNVLADIFTGNWSKIGTDTMNALNSMGAGVMQMLSGLWNLIAGLFTGAVGLVWGIVSGFVQGVVGFFTSLWSTLVGHSIVPDMITGIIQWFLKLPGQALAAVGQMVSAVVGAIQSLAGQMVSLGASIIQGLISGIMSMAGAVGNAIGNVVGGIHLPHFASGGDAPGGLAVVGERGPELVALPRGAHVYPHGSGGASSAQGGASGGGRSGRSVHIDELHVHGDDSDSTARAVVAELNWQYSLIQ